MSGESSLSIEAKGHCRSCGNQFDLFLLVEDRCSTCLNRTITSLQEMNRANHKAEQARLCAPLAPLGHNPPTSTWVFTSE